MAHWRSRLTISRAHWRSRLTISRAHWRSRLTISRAHWRSRLTISVDWDTFTSQSNWSTKNFEVFLFCSYVQTCDPGTGPILAQGHNSDQMGKGPPGDATYQIAKLYAFQFQKRRILKFVFFVPKFQPATPPGGASFDPRASYQQAW